MNSNQIVANSLTEALKDFQRAIAPLLELGKVEQWNGKTLKKKEEKRGRKRNQKSNRRRYQGEWKEPKLLTIYAVNEKGKKIKTGEVPITNDGTFGDSKELLAILEMYLVHLGINQAQCVLFIADGAEWMWKDIPPLLKRLGCATNTTYYLQDFYHVTEHLSYECRSCF